MMNKKMTILALMAVLTICLLSACGGSDPLEERAQRFAGGALSVFGGVDGADPDARVIARNLAVGREFSFPFPAYNLAAGNANTVVGDADNTFGNGNGTLVISGNACTVELDVNSNIGGITNVRMVGTFAKNTMMAAYADPGLTCPIEWTLSWTESGTNFTLTCEQVLSGTDWYEI